MNWSLCIVAWSVVRITVPLSTVVLLILGFWYQWPVLAGTSDFRRRSAAAPVPVLLFALRSSLPLSFSPLSAPHDATSRQPIVLDVLLLD